MGRGAYRPMGTITLSTICDMVILIAATITACITIINAIKNPAKKFKERQDSDMKEKIAETLKEELPKLLVAHDLEVREKYKADRLRYLNEIKAEVLSDTQDELNQIKLLKLQYESLAISARDVLREKIIKLYIDNKANKSLTILDREKLDQFYKDYKALNGNSYIDKYYNRMVKWEVIYDDDDDDDEIVW